MNWIGSPFIPFLIFFLLPVALVVWIASIIIRLLKENNALQKENNEILRTISNKLNVKN